MKKQTKVLSIASATLATLSLANALSTNTVKADQAQMIDAPKAIAGANNKIPGKYSWGPKVTKGITQPIPFGGDSSDWANSQTSDGAKYNAVKLSGNDKLKGKVGMLYKNVGIYNGHTVDLKMTLMDWDLTFNNVSDSAERKLAEENAYAAFGTEKFSVFDPGESALKYRVDFIDTKTGEPVKVTGLWTFADIDANQHLVFDNNTMDIIDGAYYSGDAKNSNDTWLSYKKMYGSNDFYSDANLHNFPVANPTGTVGAKDRRGMLTTTFSNTDHFTMTWAYGNNTGKHVLESQARVMANPKFFGMTGKYDPDAHKNAIDKIYNYVDASKYAHAYLEFGGKGVIAPKPAEPRKYVSDSDEGTNIPAEIDTVKSVDHDMLKDRYETYHYQFVEDVPDVLEMNRFSKFQFIDELDKVLDVSNVHVYNRANQDVTDDFTVDVDSNNRLTVTAKDHALQRGDFYREQYKVNFDAKIKPGVSLADHADPKHKGQAVIYNEVTVDNGYGTAISNKTTTNVAFVKPDDKKTVSFDGEGNTDRLKDVDFGKEYKYRVNVDVPDDVNLDKLIIKDQIVPEVQNIQGTKVYDLDNDGKEITDQGKLETDTKTGQVTWTAKEPNKWHGKHLKMVIGAKLINTPKLLDYLNKDTNLIEVPNKAHFIFNDKDIPSNETHVSPNTPKASADKKIEVTTDHTSEDVDPNGDSKKNEETDKDEAKEKHTDDTNKAKDSNVSKVTSFFLSLFNIK